MYLNIKRDAIFVADSHYNEKRLEFRIFLEKLQSGEVKCSQLFLMGDIFDFIAGEIDFFIKQNQDIIDKINELSNNLEVVYLEGNHDFNLKKLFPKVLIIERKKQPVFAKYGEKSVKIAHGDIFTPWHYNLYCSIIRNHYLLKILNFLDFNYLISKKVYYTLIEKNICRKMEDFNSFAKNRVKNYNSDIIIEGHYHEGKSYEHDKKLYVNIPSLCCDKKYFRLADRFIGENL
ncbi:UDP-2,3-diacylglucosamine diphosphatase [Halarcobacter ebronensis]|uniref:UDP-2,3-diacylglucosamine hydrolase n=1 Tax=Halarcobacter ebronensis TaxID=1462615 RepID=A0A4Q1AKG9_9BACT|nr:UDP-2,3-diacylglucosamine diphosphatase [Halarcobacter ebronensis]QKF81358.1 UDP-2,3-diacylglucosamine hydrolase [Halarcobacter ebronensis]RXK04919.1 UDP-2,3-diacylglucosamine hydrolase [Halarcobacter ebronensis]